MNERIKELAEQAGFKLIRENCYDIVSTMSVQEFAELIVRECAKIAIDCDVIKYSDFRQGIAREIKEHFGVEE